MTEPQKNIADVVVVGGGGSGLAAASAVARLGRSVILLEKAERLGGSTAWSVGSISATGTPHQRRAGIEDCRDELFEDLALFAGSLANRRNLALRRLLVDNITDTFDWLHSTGLVFSGPVSEPQHRHPRMHNVLPNSRAFPHHLSIAGSSVSTSAWRAQLVDLLTARGSVTEVTVQDARGRRIEITARNGVVLASGDYSGSGKMKRELASQIDNGRTRISRNYHLLIHCRGRDELELHAGPQVCHTDHGAGGQADLLEMRLPDAVEVRLLGEISCEDCYLQHARDARATRR